MSLGERFDVGLDSDSDTEPAAPSSRTPAATSLSFNLVKDISEKEVSDDIPPPPQFKKSVGGFPAHGFRGPSRFQQRQQQNVTNRNAVAAPPPQSTTSRTVPNASSQKAVPASGAAGAAGRIPSTSKDQLSESERMRIDADNRRTLADMSEDDIAKERAELLAGGIPGLTPSLIERLMRRADIDQGTAEMGAEPTDSEPAAMSAESTEPQVQRKPKAEKKVSFEESPLASPAPPSPPSPPSDSTADAASAPRKRHDPDAPPLIPPADLHPATSPDTAPRPIPIVHFSSPAEPYASLDPSSPSFLPELHKKYFADLPHDPSALSWMQDDSAVTYSPEDASIAPSALRFDFAGRLLPPSVAQAMPTDRGLHHHAHAPDAAGYTIPELAILQRSTVAAQRVVAHQTLGRFLYRLGKGEFGREGEELCEGLWRVVAGERVLDVLLAEADRGKQGRGSKTAAALATEAVWLWQQAGGRTGKEDATR